MSPTTNEGALRDFLGHLDLYLLQEQIDRETAGTLFAIQVCHLSEFGALKALACATLTVLDGRLETTGYDYAGDMAGAIADALDRASFVLMRLTEG